MTREDMLDELKQFIGRELLDGRDAGLDEHTPLLAWGVIDSLSVAELLNFTNERFEIEVPRHDVRPENLKDLNAYVGLLMRLSEQRASAGGVEFVPPAGHFHYHSEVADEGQRS
jgi:hypothetical protein